MSRSETTPIKFIPFNRGYLYQMQKKIRKLLVKYRKSPLLKTVDKVPFNLILWKVITREFNVNYPFDHSPKTLMRQYFDANRYLRNKRKKHYKNRLASKVMKKRQ